MKIFVSMLVLVALGAGIWFWQSQSEEEPTQPAQTTQTTKPEEEPKTSKKDKEVTTKNSIKEYSPEAIAKSTADYNVIFFHAPWCPICNSILANLKADSIPSSLNIYMLDWDSNQDIAEQYGVNIQYSMVQVDNDGEEIHQWINNGDEDVGAILEMVK